MEPIIALLKDTSNDSWKEALTKWCDENNSVWNFTEKYTLETKETFVALLCDKLVALSSEDEVTPLLLALRLCLRDAGGLSSAVNNPEVTKKVITISGICGDGKKVNIDGLRVVINLISKSTKVKQLLIEEFNVCEGVIRLISYIDPSERETLFLLYRIAVNLSLDNEKVSSILRKDDAVYRSIERDVCPLIPLFKSENAALFNPPMATEALKLLFSLTMHGGPLASGGETPLSDHERNGLIALFPFFDVVLSARVSGGEKEDSLSSCEDEKYRQGRLDLKVAVVDCLLNLPKDQLGAIVPKEMLMRTVDNLLVCAEEALVDEKKM